MDEVTSKLKDLESDDGCEENILSQIRNSVPLIPKIDKNENGSDTQSMKKTCEDILLDRLASAISKQKLYKQNMSATWSLDDIIIHENLKNDGSIKGAQLPKHVEENIKGIAQSAEDYISKLSEQLQDLDSADDQVSDKFLIFYSNIL